MGESWAVNGTEVPAAPDPEPGACGDPACPVLHADPANPIHPPWYVDSRTEEGEG